MKPCRRSDEVGKGNLNHGQAKTSRAGYEGMKASEIRVALDALRDLVAQIDAGEVVADEGQRAYLAGAIGALEALLSKDSHTI